MICSLGVETKFPDLFEARLNTIKPADPIHAKMFAKYDPIMQAVAPGEKPLIEAREIGFSLRRISQTPELIIATNSNDSHAHFDLHRELTLALGEEGFELTYPKRAFLTITDTNRRILVSEHIIDAASNQPPVNPLQNRETFELMKRYRISTLVARSKGLTYCDGEFRWVDFSVEKLVDFVERERLEEFFKRFAESHRLGGHEGLRIFTLFMGNNRVGIDQIPISEILHS